MCDKKISGIKSDKSSFDSLFPKNHCLSHLTVFCDFRFIYDKLERTKSLKLKFNPFLSNTREIMVIVGFI